MRDKFNIGWEHQALIRARMIYGDDELQQMFSRIRHETLCLSRDAAVLQNEVRDMRKIIHTLALR